MKIDNNLLQRNILTALSRQPRLLPWNMLKNFVSDYFYKAQSLKQIMADYLNPLYLIDLEALLNKADLFKNTFAAVLPDVGFYYAVKSNNHPKISEHLVRDAGFGLDVSSGEELKLAINSGATDIMFSGPGKTNSELELVLHFTDKTTVLIDSFGELERLGKIARQLSGKIRTGIRITPVNSSWSKFGINPDLLIEFFNLAENFKNIDCCGIQFHSSWNMNPNSQLKTIKKIGAILKDAPLNIRKKIEFIDIGGGFWPPEGEWLQFASTPAGKLHGIFGRVKFDFLKHYYNPASNIEFFANSLTKSIKKYLFNSVKCRINFEPGRWISNNSMHLLMQVIDKKSPDMVITDAGTNAIGWERFEFDYFPVLNISRPLLEEKSCYIFGSLCTPHDLWGYSYWGNDIQPGDFLLIPNQGAYTYSLRQHFIKALPETQLI